MAWSAGAAALALLLQAGVIGAVLMKNQGASYQTASLNMSERAPMTRDLGAAAPPPARWCALRRTPRWPTSTRCSTITRLRSSAAPTACSACSSAGKGKDEVAGLIGKLRSEKIVSLAEAAP